MPDTRTLEKIASTYDSTTDFDFHLIRYNYREMRPYLRGPSVLELGCASGVMTRLLSADFSHLHVVDGSAQYLKEVAATVPAAVVFHHALFEDFVCPGRSTISSWPAPSSISTIRSASSEKCATGPFPAAACTSSCPMPRACTA